MHLYFNAFKQRIVLRSSYTARENRTGSLNLIGITDLGYCIVLVLVFVGEKPGLFICGNLFLTQEMYSCDRKFILVIGNLFLL